MHPVEHRRYLQGVDGGGDELPVGQEVVSFQGLNELAVAVPERRALQHLGVDLLVLHHVGVTDEIEDGSPVLAPELVELKPLVLTAEQPRQPVLVQHVVVAAPRNMVLEEAEAVRVDGADEHRTQPVKEAPALALGDLPGDAGLQGFRRPLREGEGDDLARFDPLVDQRCHAAGDCLGLARPGAGDDLEMTASVVYHLLLLWRGGEHGCGHSWSRQIAVVPVVNGGTDRHFSSVRSCQQATPIPAVCWGKMEGFCRHAQQPQPRQESPPRTPRAAICVQAIRNRTLAGPVGGYYARPLLFVGKLAITMGVVLSLPLFSRSFPMKPPHCLDGVIGDLREVDDIAETKGQPCKDVRHPAG